MPTKGSNRYTHSSGTDVLGRRAGIPAYVLASELVFRRRYKRKNLSDYLVDTSAGSKNIGNGNGRRKKN